MMKIQWTIGNITMTIAIGVVLAFLVAELAHAEESGKVMLEVMKACKHQDTGEALITNVIPGSFGRPPTLKEINEYVASDEQFKASTQGSSPCWTKDRWKRYVRANFMEERAIWEKSSGKTLPK
jgi:hypothetical protein